MIPIAVPHLAGREREYLQECVDSSFVSTMGPFVGRFEQMVATATDADHAIATSSGTTALHAALIAAGVRPGDLVIVPTLTFIATANAVAHCGAEPLLLDVDSSSWTMDPVLLERALEVDSRPDSHGVMHLPTGRRIAAIVPVYTLGLPADMDAICAIAGRHNIPVIADGAAALGASYKQRPIGRIGPALTMISFNGNKTVTAGGGGALIGNDRLLCDLVRHLTTTARVGPDYDHDRVGYNYRMTNLQAAVGCAQMENLTLFVEKKKAISKVYNEAFSSLPGVRLFPSPDWAKSACWFSGVLLQNHDTVAVRQQLRRAGIDARPFWKPMHLQTPFAAAPRILNDVADSLWRNILVLPCSTGITDRELEQVIEVATMAIRRG